MNFKKHKGSARGSNFISFIPMRFIERQQSYIVFVSFFLRDCDSNLNVNKEDYVFMRLEAGGNRSVDIKLLYK